MKYHWDEKKYESNIRKHGIRFEEAIETFNDELAIEYYDEFNDDRIIRFGFNFHKGVLVVVYMELDSHNKRLISARKATKMEIKQYAQRI